MAHAQTLPLSRDKFLVIAINLLHRALLKPGRTQTKRMFRELADGRSLPLETVEMEDSSVARFGVSLDHSEFRGRLNYGAFRASLETLLSNTAAQLKEGREGPVFNAQDGAGAMLFGVPGATVEGEQANLLLLGTDTDSGGATMLRLMYLDPEQFREQSPQQADQTA